MQYVKLGNTGVDVSRICLGCMSFGKPGKENGVFPWAKDYDDAKPIFKKAVDLGINYFDTANVYQMGTSEEITGRLIKDFGLNRDEIVVATKVHFDMRSGRPNGGGSSRKNIMAEIDHSLKRLGLDYVDLYQIHRLDHNTPMEEIMEALHDVVKAGKARYIGASIFLGCGSTCGTGKDLQSRFRAGRLGGYFLFIPCMAKGRNLFLGCQNSSTSGALLSCGQSGLSTGRFHPRDHFFSMP